MPNSPSRDEIEFIAGSLEQHALQLWGSKKASELQSAIESTAAVIAKLQSDLPQVAEEPGFYFQ
jgi:hypothetical protein